MNKWVIIYRICWIALIAILIIAVSAMFYPKMKEYRELERRKAAIEEEKRLEEELLKHLKQQQEKMMSDPRFVERIAREELGYAKPGETVFKFIDDEQYSPSNHTR